MDKRVAELVLRKCLGWKGGESLLIVTDTGLSSLARSFHEAVVQLGVEANLVSMPARTRDGDEPTTQVGQAFKVADIAILMTSTSLTHTKARREATAAGRLRIASMPFVDFGRLTHLLDIDYDALAAKAEALAKLFEGSHTIRVTSPAGTDLEFKTGPRRVYRDDGDLSRPGAMGNLPAGEVYFAPLEGTCTGTAVINGSITGLGLAREPIRIRFEGGRAVEIGDARLAKMLQGEGLLFAEFGIGLNPHASLVGNPLEDQKAAGTAHFALGTNAAIGGTIDGTRHIAAVFRAATVTIDGNPIPADLVAAPAKSDELPVPKEISTPEIYRLMFQHSNDAQYVLDVGSQAFLEVNGAFEELTGYGRDEILRGAISPARLVALESTNAFNQRRESLKSNQSDRYDLKILCKSGDKKPVELSVRKFSVGEREVILGSIRDLSTRKKLEQEMWEKIEELGFANNRILALTEKLKRVPELAAKLMHITDEEELLERASDLLCSREGLGYSSVTFHLVKGDSLELTYSTIKTKKRRLGLATDHRLVRMVKGLDPGLVNAKEAVLPLKGRDANIGVLEVAFHPKEIEVLEGNKHALKGYQDLLHTLSSLIGLRIDNLQLFEMIRIQSIVDQITGVFNRRFFDKKLVEEVHRAHRYTRDLSLMMIDLDFFGQINKTYGHQEGDFILSELAKVFRSHTREVDMVCRYGGDEFAILMPETSYENAIVKAEKVRSEVRTRLFDNIINPDKPIKMSLSIGVAAFTKDMTAPEELLRAADEGLLESKRGGRDAVTGRRKKTGTYSVKP